MAFLKDIVLELTLGAANEGMRYGSGDSSFNTDEQRMKHVERRFEILCARNPHYNIACPENPNNPANVSYQESMESIAQSKQNQQVAGDNSMVLIGAGLLIILIILK